MTHDREARCAAVPRMPDVAHGASDSAGGTVPPTSTGPARRGILCFCVVCRSSALSIARTGRRPPRRRDVGVGLRRGRRPRRRGHGRRPTRRPQSPGRGHRHDRRPQDVRRGRDPRRRRGPARSRAGLFEMSVDGGGTLQTYCVDIYNPTQRDAKYHETPWSADLARRQQERGQDPLDPAELLPAGERPRRARREGRHRAAHRAERRRRHPGGHLALLGRRRRRRRRPAGREARRLPPEERARPVAEPQASLTLDAPARLRPPRRAARPGDRAHGRGPA